MNLRDELGCVPHWVSIQCTVGTLLDLDSPRAALLWLPARCLFLHSPGRVWGLPARQAWPGLAV